MRKFNLVFLIFVTTNSLAQPSIQSFEPSLGPIGTVVTIRGTGFDLTTENNIVFFGAVKGAISSSTSTELTATVPVGATYEPISVIVNGLIAYSTTPFVVTFDGEDLDGNSFINDTNIDAGSYPNEVHSSDLDGDGKPDLVVQNSFNRISVIQNIAREPGIISYSEKVDYVLESQSKPISTSIGDLNGDGKPDIVVVKNLTHEISIFKNSSTDGVISFESKVDYTTGSNPTSVAIGDIDVDGKPDLVVINSFGNKVSVFKNVSSGDGNISFSLDLELTTVTEPSTGTIKIGDLDGDGKPDLVVTSQTYNSVYIFRNTSSGAGDLSFDNSKSYTTGTNPVAISIGDFDGDSKIDVAVVNNGTWTDGSNSVSIFRNISDGSGTILYEAKVDITTGEGPNSISIGDLDGDGKVDIAVTNGISSSLSIFKNTSYISGSISFAPKLDFETETSSNSVSIGDINEDGKPDLIMVNGIWKVAFFTNVIPPPTITSLDDKVFGPYESRVYPNPFNDKVIIPISITHSNATIHIMLSDIFGRAISEEVIFRAETGDFEYLLDMNKLSTKLQEGVYILTTEIKTISNTELYSQKIKYQQHSD